MKKILKIFVGVLVFFMCFIPGWVSEVTWKDISTSIADDLKDEDSFNVEYDDTSLKFISTSDEGVGYTSEFQYSDGVVHLVQRDTTGFDDKREKIRKIGHLWMLFSNLL